MNGKMKALRIPILLWAGLILLAVMACGGTIEGGFNDGNGTLSLSLTDASTDQFRAVYITVDDIQVHMGGNENSAANWTSVDMPASPMTLNLLELVNGVREDMGLVDLPAGEYTQMRLIIGDTPDGTQNILSQPHTLANYLIDSGSPPTIRELKIPSGFNTGVKIVNGFEIEADRTTELVLDFDAGRSVVTAGASGNWHLKPTIKVAELHDYTIIQGSVTDGSDGIEGALVSVQTYDPEAADLKDRVTVATATVTDEFGDYSLFAAPGTYQLVAYKDGRQVAVSRITALRGRVLDSPDTNFALAVAATGQVTGTVSLQDGDSDQYATLSFRQNAVVAESAVQIETVTVNLMNATAFDTRLPVGNYALAASSFGYTSREFALIVLNGGTLEQNITLIPAP